MFRLCAQSSERCAAICRSQGRVQATADHEAARVVLNEAADFHAQLAACEDREWLRQQEQAVQQEDSRISQLRRELGYADDAL
jgi:hypothetical protein